MKHLLVSLVTSASLVCTACSDGGSDEGWNGDCDDPAAPSYESFGEQFMTSYCTRCHSSQRTGAERNTAPVGYDFDTVEGVRLYMEDVSEEVSVGGMPPTPPKPSQAEIDTLTGWIACGAP